MLLLIVFLAMVYLLTISTDFINHPREMAVLELADRIRHEIHQKKVPFSVFLYLPKAFDTLNHSFNKTKISWRQRHASGLVQELSLAMPPVC